MPTPTIPNGEEHFFPIIYEGNGAGQRVGKFVPFTDNGTIDNSCIFNRADDASTAPYKLCLYNNTGSGITGYHFDPVVPAEGRRVRQREVVNDDTENEMSSLRTRSIVGKHKTASAAQAKRKAAPKP